MSAALHNIRRPNLATTTIRVGTSYASLDLWYVDLDVGADAPGCCRHWLSDDELGRAERFHSDLDRSRYVVGRIALRRVLADRLGCSPAAVRFSYGTNGKPMLEGARGHLEFNLAHCGGDAVIALTECAAVGVDIRSEERRVGKECRCRWSAEQEKKKNRYCERTMSRRNDYGCYRWSHGLC